MTKHIYSSNPTSDKVAKASAEYVRCHFKNTIHVGRAMKGMKVERAKRFLNNVLRKQEAVPVFKTHNGGYGRHKQAKAWGTSQCFWPTKSVYAFLNLLRNAEANAKAKGLAEKDLVITHVAVNQAPKIRRRTFRAHGRINPFQSSPSHMEIIVTEVPEQKSE